MTIAIGFSCAGGGVGLLTDSMSCVGDERGHYLSEPGGRSFHRMPSVPAVAVVSGNLLRPLSAVDRFCLSLQVESVEAAARRLYYEVETDDLVLQATWPMYEQLGLGRGGTPQVLIVGGSDRDSLRVGAMNPRGVQWISWPEAGYAIVGAWVPYFSTERLLESRPAPVALADGLESAAIWARGYLDSIYAGRTLEQMVAEGESPTIGYPLRACSFEADGTMREYEVSQTEIFEVEEVAE